MWPSGVGSIPGRGNSNVMVLSGKKLGLFRDRMKVRGLDWAPDTGWSAGLPQVSSTLESGLKEPHYWGHMVLVAESGLKEPHY